MREKFLIYFSHTLTNKRYIINKAKKKKKKKKEWQRITGESIKDAVENEVEEKTNHFSRNIPLQMHHSNMIDQEPLDLSHFMSHPFQHVPFCPLPPLSALRSATKRLLWPQRSVLGQNKEKDNWMTHSHSSSESGLIAKTETKPQDEDCAHERATICVTFAFKC